MTKTPTLRGSADLLDLNAAPPPGRSPPVGYGEGEDLREKNYLEGARVMFEACFALWERGSNFLFATGLRTWRDWRQSDIV